MITNNPILYSFKIILEIISDVVYFPVWWYTRGLVQTIRSLLSFLSDWLKITGLLIWIKNIFVPMFGQTDWQGRLISFFIRLIQIIARSIVMLVILAIALFLLIFWISFPIIVLLEITYQVLPQLFT